MNNDTVTGESIEKTLGITRGGSKKRSRLRYIIPLVLILGTLAAWYLLGSSGKKKVSYETGKVTRQELVITVSATGNLEPTNTVDVGIEVSGTISEVDADYNQRVKKGEVLARLDTTRLAAQATNSRSALLVAKANLSESRVSLDDAKNELNRATKMYESTKGNYPSDKEMDALRYAYSRAKAAYDAAVARVAQAEAQLKSDEDNLKKAVVTSPFDGIVLDRKIEPGQTVAATLQTPVLFTLAEDLTQMEVVVSVDEADVGQVREGQKVTFTVDAYPGKTFHGEIAQVRLNSVIVSGVVTYETVVVVDNSELLLRPGMTASAEIITQTVPNTLVVPNAALRFVPPGEAIGTPGKGIWTIGPEGKPRRLAVTAGETDGIVTAISGEGITEGMTVILNTKQEVKRP